MASFGVAEGVRAALAGPAKELNDRLDRIAEEVSALRTEQGETNRLLAELVEQGKPAGKKTPRRSAEKLGLEGDGR